ncbi:Hypothetical predicted protein [Cloeon dipterum]|uniref:C-type lectin domain-containing protein n=1 Tax=Cloeon dipterum TaxID=197152 RepID=A0A8S1E134_9INSE|nr:Hypothetical predicted protein [Cloeon dipterum]
MDVSKSGAAQQKADETHGENNGSAGPSSTPEENSADKAVSIDDLKKEIDELRNEVRLAMAKEKINDEEIKRIHELTACRRRQLKKERNDYVILVEKFAQKLAYYQSVAENDRRLFEENWQSHISHIQSARWCDERLLLELGFNLCGGSNSDRTRKKKRMEALNLEDAFEQEGLTNLTVGNKSTDWKANFNYWTSGLRQGASVGRWVWCRPNGPTVFTSDLKWELGQPDNAAGNEDCAHFRFVLNSTGTIITDRNCMSRYIFACKMQISTTPKPCIVSCPRDPCKRNATLFDTGNYLKNGFSYGNWHDGCGRQFLFYFKNPSNWTTAYQHCCGIGLTLASMETEGKRRCLFNLITTQYNSENFGDFWISGTDLGCPSDYHWCSLNRDFVNPEIRWKDGHPMAGRNCVYLEIRNESMLLATADCNEEKMFLCDVRKNATIRRGMQGECAEIWNITTDQIDLLLNASAFLSENISLNLKVITIS